MTENTQYLLEYLFGAGKLEDVSLDQLQELVDEYPSFNAGHYLLSKKLQQENYGAFLTETKKTALYFNNPFWLQWLLLNNDEEQTKTVNEPIIHDEKPEEQVISYTETYHYEEEIVQAVPVQADTSSIENEYKTILPEEPEPEIHTEHVQEEKIYETFIAETPIFSNPHQSTVESSYQEPTETEKQSENMTPGEIQEEEWHETSTFLQINITEQQEHRTESYQPEFIETEKSGSDTTSGDKQEEDWHEAAAFSEVNLTEQQEPVTESSHQEARETEKQRENMTPDEIQEEEWHEASTFLQINITEQEEPVIEASQSEFIETEELNVDTSPGDKQEEDWHEIPAFSQINTTDDQESVETKTSPMDMPINNTREEELQESSGLSHITNADDDEMIWKSYEPAAPIAPEQIQNDVPLMHAHDQPTIEEQSLSEEQKEKPIPMEQEDTIVNDLVFEPYHTVDYFASQGIYLAQEENPTDKFGKQLKSFTDWLKVMKRLPQYPLQLEADEVTNAQIEVIAASSLEGKDVITETMAEVLAKQDKIEDAINLYLKLSLLNPTKIAYFAAKIEELKKNNLI